MVKHVKKKMCHKKKAENFITVLKKMVGPVNGFENWDTMEYTEKHESGTFYLKRSILQDMRRAFNAVEQPEWIMDFCDVATSFRNIKTGKQMSSKQFDMIRNCIQKYIEDVYMLPTCTEKVRVQDVVRVAVEVNVDNDGTVAEEFPEHIPERIPEEVPEETMVHEELILEEFSL